MSVFVPVTNIFMFIMSPIFNVNLLHFKVYI
ncbi:hypothetical protein F9B77_04490 [Staphylococcus epidermidis]|uniref:Uncharacterized protein n=1 Tax=Staphylococcus epidermidis (strain ATCC 12228 / FDA PCI 1200) TaxID=176280 RepID=A0A0H2VFZ4_STAES|nr:hypothetical protein SE_0178 [Staphylococcus epidermidis ATCC 12228]AVA10962.1 hypothetical protein AL514_04850 [Staphylococcus epidermidis]MBA9941375.1 hypothetical protein [Ralstonia insidiosa]AVG08407.1 hypothetical protein AL521_01385 [Staphylococcus epidermidis]AXE40426.1 hypothetical protein DQW72_00575 [Staphylococcus epidermidis]